MEYDFSGKYTKTNAVTRRLLDGFYGGVTSLLGMTDAASVLEVGCGPGFSTERLVRALPEGTRIEACDVETRLVEQSRARNPGVPVHERSIYDLRWPARAFDVVVCLEVLEHLDDPERGLRELVRVAGRWLILSVPREPLWRTLNMARLKYLGDLGNTPGHVQHWSTRGFRGFVAAHAEPVAVRTPVPWTQLLARVS
ncbi:MAG: class I SAM-dependent methyltransferase [Myxococcota bacterium]